MTITAALASPTPLSLTAAVGHDGAAGNSLTITNAELQAAMVAGPLKRLFSRTYADQSAARAAILNGVVTAIGGDVQSRGIDVTIMPRDSVATVPWGVDIGVDGALLPTLIVTGIAAAASVALYRIEFRHSLTR